MCEFVDFIDGSFRLDSLYTNVKYFELHLGKKVAFVNVLNGIIISAGFVGQLDNHCYFEDKPDWNKAYEVLQKFHVENESLYNKIMWLLDRNSKEFKELRKASPRKKRIA